ncbi:MAG: FAD-binding oxidoreductase [Bdellovibrio sp.]|nr:FAD-binding oxidoreductase [Methylotenera sp.]
MLANDLKLTQNSYYAASANEQPHYPKLEGDIIVDVCVVGGGFAGLSSAIELRDRGYTVAVLEANHIGFGASGRNGGQLIAGLACEQDVIEKEIGFDGAKQVWNMTLEALDLVRERVKRFNINCDLQDGFLGVSVNEKKGKQLRHWFDDMQKRYHYAAEWIEPAHIKKWIDSPRYFNGYYDKRGGHIHPLNYCLGLARGAAGLGVQIYQHSAVTAMQQGQSTNISSAVLQTDKGQVKAKFVVLAGNIYLPEIAPQLAPKIAKRIMPVGTYIIGTEPIESSLAAKLIPSNAAVCDTNFVLDYFRLSRDKRMIYGGRVSYSAMTPPNLTQSMQARLVKTFPQLKSTKVEYTWGGFVDISMNRAPDFGRVAPNIYYLQGFSGHGVALTGLAGKLVAEAISGQATRFDVFADIKHHDFFGGKLLRTPALVLGMAWYQLREKFG